MSRGCPFRKGCAFFKLFGIQPRDGLGAILDSYCLSDDGFRRCWRLAYRQDNGASPPPHLTPSGEPCRDHG